MIASAKGATYMEKCFSYVLKLNIYPKLCLTNAIGLTFKFKSIFPFHLHSHRLVQMWFTKQKHVHCQTQAYVGIDIKGKLYAVS